MVDTQPVDNSMTGDEPIDYMQFIEANAFIGDTPYGVIKESITTQFEDYINLEDTTNYVELFYQQIHASYAAIDDEEEIHKDEVREIVDSIQADFVTFMKGLFERRLAIALMDIESETLDYDNIEFAVSIVYDFFILHARNNFINVIYRDIKTKIKSLVDNEDVSDKVYFDTINEMLKEYSPLVLAVTPMHFIQLSEYTQADELIDLFSDGRISGNFLRRYSPKLYANEELEVDIINHITMAQQLRRDLTDGDSAATE